MYTNIYQPEIQLVAKSEATTHTVTTYANNYYYILPMDNDVELGRFAGRFVAPVKISTKPVFKDGYLDIDFSFMVAGQYELPSDAFYCDVAVLDQVVKNVPVFCQSVGAYGSPNIYTYEGHVKINLVNQWLNNGFHHKQIEIQIQPFLNPEIPNKYEIVVGGGKFQLFLQEWKDFCCFKTYYEISNYFDQSDLTLTAYNDWKPTDYIFDYKTGVRPEIKKINKPNYYFEPKQEEFHLNEPLFTPFKTNAINSPKKEFAKAKIILDYQVKNQPEKQLVYDYSLNDLPYYQEFNLGFKTIYDQDKHELKIVSGTHENGTNGIYFPEPTTFSLKYVFQDKQSFGTYYTGTIQGSFDENLFQNNQRLNLSVNILDSNASGNWLSVDLNN